MASSLRFRFYVSPNQKAFTQCRRCLLYGHRTRHCNLPPHCMYCSEDHLSESCEQVGALIDAAQLNENADSSENMDDSSEKQPESQTVPGASRKVNVTTFENGFRAKCYNCGGGHIALSDKCPEKTKYANLQKQLSQRNRQHLNLR